MRHVLDPYKALGDRIRHILDLHELLKRKEIVDYYGTFVFWGDACRGQERGVGDLYDESQYVAHGTNPSKALIFEGPLSHYSKKYLPASKEGFGHDSCIKTTICPATDEMLVPLVIIPKLMDTLKEISWHTLEASSKRDG